MKFIILSLFYIIFTQKGPPAGDLLKKTRLLSCLSLTQLRLQQDKSNIDNFNKIINENKK